MLNSVQIIGRLGSDPETRTVGNGQTLANFSVATSERWKDKDGQQQERTEWHRVVAWGQTSILVGKYLSKGSQCYVEGKLQTRSWENKEGNKVYTTEIHASKVLFLDPKEKSESSFGAEPSFDSTETIPF